MESKNASLPKKGRKPRKRKQEETPKDGIDIATLIKTALKNHLDQQKDAREVDDELDAMVSTCEEFMGSFIILGYDLNGCAIDPIVMAHSQQEADSLGCYLNKFIASQMQSNS